MKKDFVYGVAVTDYNFMGRQEEIRRLKMNFENGINSILISPRRWGFKKNNLKYLSFITLFDQ